MYLSVTGIDFEAAEQRLQESFAAVETDRVATLAVNTAGCMLYMLRKFGFIRYD